MSVIIPTHNLSTLIGGAIRSVVEQTFQDWELIVVDDASSDDTEGRVRQFAEDQRIRYLRHISNRGPAAARNAGFAASNGEFICFLDADDRWLPSKLEEQLSVLQDDSIGVCCVAAYEQYPGGEVRLRRKMPPFEGDALYLELLFRNTIPGSASAVMLRRARLEEVGPWDESLRGGEDRDLWLRLALTTRFAFIERPLVRIDRSREDRATRNWLRMAANRERYLRKREHDVPERFRSYLPALRRRIYQSIASCHYRIGDLRNVRRYSIRAMLASPRFDPGLRRACGLLLRSFLERSRPPGTGSLKVGRAHDLSPDP